MPKMQYIAYAVPFLLGACAPALQEKPLQVGQVQVPAAMIDHNAAVQPVSGIAMAQWWLVFNDPLLNEMLAAGIRDNPGLAEAKARIGIAQGQLLLAGASDRPQLGVGGDAARVHRSDNGDHAVYNGETYTVANINPLMVDYRLDIFGVEQEKVAMATAGRAMAEAQYRESQLLLRAAIIKTYFALKTAGLLVDRQEETVRLAQARHAVAAAAYKAGLQTSSASLMAKARIAEARSRLAGLRQQQQGLQFALAALLGKGPEYKPDVSQAHTELPASLPVPATIALNALSQRPDIEEALSKIRYFQHAEKSAQQAFYPNINLRALVGLNSIGLGNLLSAGSLGYAVGPALSLPIFDGGALKGRLQAESAAYEAAIYGYNQSILKAASQVATYLAVMDNTKQSLGDRQENFKQLQANARVAEAGYKSGISDKSEVIGAKLEVNAAAMHLMESELSWLTAMTDLATALGGEFQGAAGDAH